MISSFLQFSSFSFDAKLCKSVGWEEGHLACKNTCYWNCGGSDLTRDLHVLPRVPPLPLPAFRAKLISRLTQVVLEYWPLNEDDDDDDDGDDFGCT